MEISETMRSVGLYGGLGGIALAAAFFFYKDVIKRIELPKLTRKQSYLLLRLMATLMFLLGIAGLGSHTYIRFVEASASGPEHELNPRIGRANTEYDNYETTFAAAVNAFANENLEAVFAECISQVSIADPAVPLLLEMVRKLDVTDEQQREDLRAQITRLVGPHRERVETVIFDRFNTRLMSDLRSLAGSEEYSPWMRRALLEWTDIGNFDSMLVQDCITELLGDENRLAAWLYAYIRRDQEPSSWRNLGAATNLSHELSKDPVNLRLDLLATLERLVGKSLNEGRREILDIVRNNFPSMEAVPSPPKDRR